MATTETATEKADVVAQSWAPADAGRSSGRAQQTSSRAGNWDRLLRRAGFTSRQQGTSHKVYTHPRLVQILSIPQRARTVKAPYVDKTVKAILEVTDDDD